MYHIQMIAMNLKVMNYDKIFTVKHVLRCSIIDGYIQAKLVKNIHFQIFTLILITRFTTIFYEIFALSTAQ